MNSSSSRCSTPSVILLRRASRIALSLLLLGGCSATELSARHARAGAIAAQRDWQPDTIGTPTFQLAAWLGPVGPGRTLTVYIEGDGFAWATSSRPSFNPTPREPIGLALALRHPDGNVAYLARPCQYIDLNTEPDCTARTWTRDRFAESVVAASDAALSTLMSRYGADRLALVGYSGGGAVATLVAARRTDVVRLTTVAAPLDLTLWTSRLNLSPLTGSLNPADAWARLSGLPQVHYVGTDDTVIDITIAESFRSHFEDPSQVRVVPVDGFDHRCCWVDAWTELAAEPPREGYSSR